MRLISTYVWQAPLWLTLVATQAGAQQQQQQQPPDAPFRITSEVRIVVLEVSVRDRRGAPLTSLPREAFRIFDSGREQRIASFAGVDAPVTVGIVADISGSMRPRRQELVSAAMTFIEASNPVDETFLVTFNDSVQATANVPAEVLRAQLEKAPMEGRTALFDAIHQSLRRLQQGTRERKVLVVVSDGGDNVSAISRADIVRHARESQAAIYTVGLSDPSNNESDMRFLHEIAYATGGGSYTHVPISALQQTCLRIAQEIRSRYSLSFYATEAQYTETRPLKVEVKAPGYGHLRVLTRPSYTLTGSMSP
jgi:Ca-activated chloride channel family protein